MSTLLTPAPSNSLNGLKSAESVLNLGPSHEDIGDVVRSRVVPPSVCAGVGGLERQDLFC